MFLKIQLKRAAGVLVLASLVGCSGASALDERDEWDPLYRRAQEFRRAQDYDKAIEMYNRALDRKPNLAMAHLELGFIYDEYREDYIRAIYHYQRYLEMRPDAEKKQLVTDLIQHAKLSFAASLPDKPAEAVAQIALLKREIETLREQLVAQQSALGTNRPAVASAGAVAPRPVVGSATVAASAPVPPAPPPPQPAAPVAAPQTYTVQTGDTLSRIAGRVYGDSKKWEIIYRANRNILPTPQSLKVGQVLTIPPQ